MKKSNAIEQYYQLKINRINKRKALIKMFFTFFKNIGSWISKVFNFILRHSIGIACISMLILLISITMKANKRIKEKTRESEDLIQNLIQELQISHEEVASLYMQVYNLKNELINKERIVQRQNEFLTFYYSGTQYFTNNTKWIFNNVFVSSSITNTLIITNIDIHGNISTISIK